jgi:aspartate kinase
MPQIVVQKFGGSSVADVEKIRAVARRVKARRDDGVQLVVVVSAMGDTTDELLGLARKVSNDPPRRELDMLLTCGERISMALLSMALQEQGVTAISFTGSQSGIITDDAHAQARIVEVRPARIEEELAKGKVVIVAGYQGVSRTKEITTLGRGGSDTTAVALAAALGADCEIYSDVDGVFTADPRIVPGAQKLPSLSFDEMQELAASGAKVLNAQAIEFAREKGITIHAKSTHTAGTGTRVEAKVGSGIKGVTSDGDVWVLSVQGPPEPLLDLLDARQVRGRSLLFEATDGSEGETMVIVPLQDVHGSEALRQEIAQKLGGTVTVRDDLGTVTCVGTGLNASWSTVRRVMSTSALAGAAVFGAFSSPLQVTLVVGRRHLKDVTARLHEALLGS